MLEKLRYINIKRIRRLRYIHIPNLLILNKRKTSFWLFTIGIAINVFASIYCMYLWPLGVFYPILTVPFFLGALLFSYNASRPIFTRPDFFLPTILCLALQYYQCIVNDQNVIPYIVATCTIFCYYCLFSIDKASVQKAMTCICKGLAGFLIISISTFLLYVLGFNLPNTAVTFGNYSYTNYMFFLLDDRELWSQLLLPRFHSVFLEPGHMGTTIVMLLATQIGKWKTWYNTVLIIALLLSFSLAAYCLGVILIFLRLWLLRRKIIAKLIILVSSIIIVVGASFIYKGGDNMLNTLIVMRLEMNDSGDDFEGNNRVSEDFKKEFDSFIDSSDILFGREMDRSSWGNSGYRVYIYDYGIIGLLLFLVFYYFAFRSGTDKRAISAAFILSLTNFWIRGYPMIFAFLFPYFLISQLDISRLKEHTLPDEPNEHNTGEQ